MNRHKILLRARGFRIVRIILFSLVYFFSLAGFSQHYLYLEWYDPDSLHSLLPNQSGEERINTLNKLATSLYYEDSRLSEMYVDEAMQLARKLEYQKGEADAYRNYGHIYNYHSQYPDALNNYLESLRIHEELHGKKVVAKINYDIAVTHYFARNYEKSLEYANIALDIFREQTQDGETLGGISDTLMIFSGIGLVYSEMGMSEKALEIRLAYLEVVEQNHRSDEERVLFSFLSGTSYLLLGKPDSARKYFEKALAVPDGNSSVEALKIRPLTWMGMTDYWNGEYDAAFPKLQSSFEWYNERGFLYMALVKSSRIGSYYYEINDWTSAKYYYHQSEKIFNEMVAKDSWYRHDSLKRIVSYGLELYIPMPLRLMKEMTWSFAQDMFHALYQLNSALGSTGEAMKYYIAYSNAKDTLSLIKHSRETMEMQIRYDTQKKEAQIEFLGKENEFNQYKLRQSRYFLLGLAGLVLIIIMLAIILIRQNRYREKQKNMLLQQKLFRSQMNPHFLFNTLVSIQNFIINREPLEAGKYLSKFSKLVRNILDSSVDEYISLGEEISTIGNYLALQQIRYPDKFEYHIETDNKIDIENTHLPPMLLQPFIENSIEHGFKHKKGKGKVLISFKLENNSILIELEDNGIGRQKSKEMLEHQGKDHKSLATSIIEERIRVLNKTLKKKITLQIIDLYNDQNHPSGTKVVLRIPI